ncbi:hypothetical protein PybrP1_002274 [[Pythium] brassicae (nom. inval.)]|nr:hypothetical protein PybrP1_002274 [[Pythium] brassicae (nom. inval.)]
MVLSLTAALAALETARAWRLAGDSYVEDLRFPDPENQKRFVLYIRDEITKPAAMEYKVCILVDKMEMNCPHFVVATLDKRTSMRTTQRLIHEKILLVDGIYAIHAYGWVKIARAADDRSGRQQQRGGSSKKLAEEHVTFLIEKLSEHCELTLRDMAELVEQEFGVAVHGETVRRALDARAFTVKGILRDGWEDMVMAALAGDPVFYGVMASITVCMLAFVGLLAAKLMLDQLEEDEAAARRARASPSSARKGEGDNDGDNDGGANDGGANDGDSEPEDKKQQ